MLRSGYSSDAVIHELVTRRFADDFNPETEKHLKQAGASAALLDALRGGTYQLSADEIAAFEQKRVDLKQRASDAVAEVEPVDQTTRQTNPSQNPRPAVAAPAINEVYRLLKGDLVSCQNGNVAPFDDEALQSKKLFLFFFSANWSPPGRKFTPRLIEYYERVTAQHPELEVIFFSTDRSQFGMETYMRQTNMPWPAVAFPQINLKAAAMATDSVHDMPCLILVNAGGRILSSSARPDGDPEKVLADLDKLFAGGAGPAAARTR